MSFEEMECLGSFNRLCHTFYIQIHIVVLFEYLQSLRKNKKNVNLSIMSIYCFYNNKTNGRNLCHFGLLIG